MKYIKWFGIGIAIGAVFLVLLIIGDSQSSESHLTDTQKSYREQYAKYSALDWTEKFQRQAERIASRMERYEAGELYASDVCKALEDWTYYVHRYYDNRERFTLEEQYLLDEIVQRSNLVQRSVEVFNCRY